VNKPSCAGGGWGCGVLMGRGQERVGRDMIWTEFNGTDFQRLISIERFPKPSTYSDRNCLHRNTLGIEREFVGKIGVRAPDVCASRRVLCSDD